ncbi:MAG: hypothetical protein FWH29_09390 [Methanobrevibacter sp.]|nr:hypothetical protein [Methanobrevibacter sp.]
MSIKTNLITNDRYEKFKELVSKAYDNKLIKKDIKGFDFEKIEVLISTDKNDNFKRSDLFNLKKIFCL